MTGTFTLRQVSDEEDIHACHKIQQTVFQNELGFSAMSIPDEYDEASLYVSICECENVVGAFRVVLADDSSGLPIRALWPEVDALSDDQVCELSRIAILKRYWGCGLLGRAISFAKTIAKENNASLMVADVLLANRERVAAHGFECVGAPYCDPSVDKSRTGDVNCVPMMMDLSNPPQDHKDEGADLSQSQGVSAPDNLSDSKSDLRLKQSRPGLTDKFVDADAEDQRSRRRKDHRLAVASIAISCFAILVAIAVALYAASVTRDAHTDAALLDAAQEQYSSYIAFNELQLANSQLVHLTTLPKNYDRVVEQVRRSTTGYSNEHLTRLELQERPLAIYVFSLYEHALYQYKHAQKVGDVARKEFFDEVVGYFTKRLLRNPRLLSLWDPEQGGLSGHYEQGTRDHYLLHVLQDEQIPLLKEADHQGPFSRAPETTVVPADATIQSNEPAAD